LNGSDKRKTFSRLERLRQTVRELLDLSDDLVSGFHVVIRDPDLDDVQDPSKEQKDISALLRRFKENRGERRGNSLQSNRQLFLLHPSLKLLLSYPLRSVEVEPIPQ